ncbi:MAG: ABC transporter permease [Clostridiales bacterium]|nr:ABC transporter permease [Clostridiales bacterium]
MSFFDLVANIGSETVLFAVPLLLVALGGMFSERGGIINIALEGIMVVGALVGCIVMITLHEHMGVWSAANPELAMLISVGAAAISGLVYSLLLGFASIHLRADQTIGGTALNMLAPAAAIVVTWAVYGRGQTSINFGNVAWRRITLARVGGDPETAGIFLRSVFKSMYVTTPLAIILLVLAIILLYKTRFGLRLRACGEHPQAADSVGINVYKMRYAGVAISGFLAGIGGLAFTLAAGTAYQSTVAGYGFLALSVMIFGNWKPMNIAGAALFFALFKVMGNYAGVIPFLPSFEGIKFNAWIYNILPYVVTMFLLVLTSKRSRAPKAEGIPYDKSTR